MMPWGEAPGREETEMHITPTAFTRVVPMAGARVLAYLARLDIARVTVAQASALLVARGLLPHAAARVAAEAWGPA